MKNKQLFNKAEIRSAEPNPEEQYNAMHDWLKKNYFEIWEEYWFVRKKQVEKRKRKGNA